MTDTTKSLRLLQVWVGVLTLLVLVLLLALGYLLRQQQKQELTAERINIVEPDGQLKLVISNSQRQHPGLVAGKPLPRRERGAGLTFFNEAGDECGGLLYNGNQREASMVYSIDQFRNDQLMQLQYNQHAGAGQVSEATACGSGTATTAFRWRGNWRTSIRYVPCTIPRPTGRAWPSW